MKWWVANGLEQAPAQWYQDAHSFCLGVNLLVRGSSPPPLPLQFSWPKKLVSALMVYWPVPAAINKHKVAWLVLHNNPGDKICIIWLSFFTSLYLPFSAPAFSQIKNLTLLFPYWSQLCIPTYGIMMSYQPYVVLLLWLHRWCWP